MKVILSTRGQISLPAAFRKQDDIQPGREFEVARLGFGKYQITLVSPPPNRGVVAWLRSCPAKDYFVPIDSESTGTLSS